MMELPDGFILDEQQADPNQLPDGFVLDNGQVASESAAPRYTMTPEEIQANQEAAVRGPKPQAPERSFLDKVIGIGETGLSLATGSTTGMLAGVPVGIAGAIGNLAGILTQEEAQALQERAMSAVTYEPKTEAGQEYAGAVGDVMNVLPPVTSASLPTTRVTPRGAVRGAVAEEARARKSFTPKGYKAAFEAKPDDVQQMLRKGDESSIATAAKVDPEIELATARLGMQEEGLLSHKATDPNVIANEQILKSVPGSPLQIMEDAYVKELNAKADDLINSLGSTDKSSIDNQIFKRSDDAINGLSKAANDAYNSLSEKIDPKTIAKLDDSRAYINEIVENLGGDVSQLTPLEKRLKNMADRDGITYTAVDRLRKQVGSALGKESDVFSTETKHSLGRIYDVLTNDQESVAPELAGDWAKAKSLVQKRKVLEEQAMTAFGKKLTDSYIPKLGASLKVLNKGKKQEFHKMIQSIDKRDRPKAIATALADVFQGSSQQPQMTPAAFDSWYRSITKNGVKRDLYRYLPADFTHTLDDLATVTGGLRRAQSKEIKTGRLATNPGVMGKALDIAIKGALSKVPGMIGEATKMIADSASKRPETEALKVLSNPDFIRGVSAIAEGNAKKAAEYEKKIRNRPYGRKALGELSLLGFVNSFGKQQGEDNQQNEQQ